LVQSDMPGAGREDQKASLDIYLAEYGALTNRITYWIYLQYLSYSVLAVLLTVIVQAWGSPAISNSTRVWGGLLLLQLLLWAWVYATWEILNTAVYLEGGLRLKIRDLVTDKSFWGWEPYLADQRRRGYNRYEWRFALLGLLLFVLPTIAWLIWKVTPNFCDVRSYGGWAGANAYIAVMIALRVHDTSKLQSQLQQIWKSNGAFLAQKVATGAPPSTSSH